MISTKEVLQTRLKDILRDADDNLLNLCKPREYALEDAVTVPKTHLDAFKLNEAKVPYKSISSPSQDAGNLGVVRIVLPYEEASYLAQRSSTAFAAYFMPLLQATVNELAKNFNLTSPMLKHKLTLERPGSGEIIREMVSGSASYELRFALTPL